MKLYLDNSFLNRPFDDQNIGANKIETEVLFFILNLMQNKKIKIVNSSVIEYENSLNPFSERKIFVKAFINQASEFQNINEEIRLRSLELNKHMNILGIDALHIASAETAQVDFFLTCDYNVIKRYKGSLFVINPVTFLTYYESSN